MPDTQFSLPLEFRFSLVLSGGIALGSYIAGVLTQLYADLEALNSHPTLSQSLKFEIDVIAGASAGSITGLTLARAIVTGASPRAFGNAISDCWVRGLSVQHFLQFPEDVSQGVISGKSLEEVARQVFAVLPELNAPSPETPDARKERQQRAEGRSVALWLSLTNLSGTPFCVNFNRPDHPQTSRPILFANDYRDCIAYYLTPNETRKVCLAETKRAKVKQGIVALRSVRPPDRVREVAEEPTTWDSIKDSAVASGAFPIAFQSRPQVRDLTQNEGFNSLLETISQSGEEVTFPTQAMFHFVDGGIFNNQPIGRAIEASLYQEERRENKRENHRIYLVIEPDPVSAQSLAASLRNSTREAESSPHGLPPLSAIARVVGAYFNHALASDFLEAQRINERVTALDAELKNIHLEDKDEETLLKGRIKKAAGLGHQRPITLEHIPLCDKPLRPSRLAGDFMGHFGGFLREDLREYDYALGKCEAREWLEAWLESVLSEDESLLPKAQIEENLRQIFAHSQPIMPGTDLSAVGWDNPDDLNSLTKSERDEIKGLLLGRIKPLLIRWIRSPRILLGVMYVAFRVFLLKITRRG